jgi:predicted O-methyltransferase YrrM
MGISKSSKMREWVSLSLRNPVEAYDRVATVVDVKSDKWFVSPPDYSTVSYEEVWDRLLEQATKNGADYGREAHEVEELIKERNKSIVAAPIDQIHSADFALARICYLATRVARPKTIVETGVAYGVTSAFILSALAKNGDGCLHSVDLPPLGRDVDRFVGALIPEELRDRWRLYRGVTKRVMPKLLERLGHVEMFVHDSLHTYRNIRFELEAIAPYLTPGAVVVADDIDENPAFLEWVKKMQLSYSGVVREERKTSLLGVAVLSG